MAGRGYKPGMVVDWLGITREQLRYWRRELDPVASRPPFSYHIVVAYAVLHELIAHRWLSPRHLKQIDLAPFFHWFEAAPSERQLRETVLTIDKHRARVRFESARAHRGTSPAPQAAVEVV